MSVPATREPSALKREAARGLADEYGFASTGDPKTDIIIAAGLRDLAKEEASSDEIRDSDEDIAIDFETGFGVTPEILRFREKMRAAYHRGESSERSEENRVAADGQGAEASKQPEKKDGAEKKKGKRKRRGARGNNRRKV